MATSKTTSTSDNKEPEFWTILKTPVETRKSIFTDELLEYYAKILDEALTRHGIDKITGDLIETPKNEK